MHDGTVLPNLSFIHFSAKEDVDRSATAFLSLRTWQPLGPGLTRESFGPAATVAARRGWRPRVSSRIYL